MKSQDLQHHHAVAYQHARPPRGAWRIVATAAIFTLALFLLLPLAEKLTPAPAVAEVEVRPARTLHLPEPPRVHEPISQPPQPEPLPATPQAAPPPPLPEPPPRPTPPPPQPQTLALAPPELQPITDLTFTVQPPPPEPPAAEPQPAVAESEPAPEPTVAAPEPTVAAPEPTVAAPEPAPAAPTTPAAPGVFGADEVDRLPRATHAPRPPYPAIAQRRRIEGYAEARFVVTRDGAVTEVEIVGGQPAGLFEDATREGLSRWRFEPATRDGRPVAVRVQLRIRYHLD